MMPNIKRHTEARRSSKTTRLAERANSAGIRQAARAARRKGIPAALQTIRPVPARATRRDGNSSVASFFSALKRAIGRLYRQDHASGHRLVSGS